MNSITLENIVFMLFIIISCLQINSDAQIVLKARNHRKDNKAFEEYVNKNIECNFVKNNTHQYGFDDFTGGEPPSSESTEPVYMSIIPQKESKLDFIRNELSYNANNNTELPRGKTVKFKILEYESIKPNPKETRNIRQIISFLTNGNCTFSIKAKYDNSIRAICKVFSWRNLKKKIAVQVIHEENYNTTIDINSNSIETELNKIYKQACLSFKVTKLSSKTVAFDKYYPDGKLEVALWENPELTEIITFVENDQTIDTDQYDFILFFVSNPKNKLGLPHHRQYGFMKKGQKYGFVFTSNIQVIAHELGHGLFLEHVSNTNDSENLMNEFSDDSKTRLRYMQWETIQK